MKALTAMKLTKEDAEPGKVFEDIFIGSIGCAYNNKKMKELGITHILCCAANIKPRFPEVSIYLYRNCFLSFELMHIFIHFSIDFSLTKIAVIIGIRILLPECIRFTKLRNYIVYRLS